MGGGQNLLFPIDKASRRQHRAGANEQPVIPVMVWNIRQTICGKVQIWS